MTSSTLRIGLVVPDHVHRVDLRQDRFLWFTPVPGFVMLEVDGMMERTGDSQGEVA